jgi:hypothetical protein
MALEPSEELFQKRKVFLQECEQATFNQADSLFILEVMAGH